MKTKRNKGLHNTENTITLYRQVFHTSQIGMAIYDACGQCIEANETISSLIGASREQALLQNYYHIESWKKYGLLDTALAAVREKSAKHREESVISSFGCHITIDYHFIPFTVMNKEYLLLVVLDVTGRKKAELAQGKLVQELQKALSEVRTLKGILPICASCKKIRDDKGYWEQIEIYIKEHSEADFSHSICPECAKKLYPDLYSQNNSM